MNPKFEMMRMRSALDKAYAECARMQALLVKHGIPVDGSEPEEPKRKPGRPKKDETGTS